MNSMSCSRCGERRPRRAAGRMTRLSVLAVSLAAALAAGACSSSASNATAPEGSPTARAAATTAADAKLAQLRKQLDAELLAGPTINDELGYRTLWQTRVDTAGGSGLRGSECTRNEVFVWDSIGVITRLRPTTGDSLWQAASSSRVDRILSVLLVETFEGKALVALVSDTQVFLYDASNGLFVSRQNFGRMANTPAILRHPYLIYGTRAGQVVWHNFEVGSESRVTQLAGQITTAPRLVGEIVAAAGSGGTVAVYTARDARQLWSRPLNAGITARPAADERAIWVPCRDQYLTCLSLQNGRPLWRYFSQSPMDASPSLLEDALYMQLPGEGLVCFDPLSPDKFDGLVRWRSPEAIGDVIGVCRNGLIAWDAPTRTLTLLEERSGSVIRSFIIPGAADLKMTDGVDGDIVITGLDGRVQRLTPIARRTATKA